MRASGVYNKGELNFGKLFTQILTRNLPKEVGAVATFVGITRVLGKAGKKVSLLEMESYEEHANKTIRKICEEVKSKYNLALVRVYHLIGKFKVGSPVVFVVVAGRYRRDVFPALQETVERYKTEPALFKKEVYVGGAYEWIEGG